MYQLHRSLVERLPTLVLAVISVVSCTILIMTSVVRSAIIVGETI